MSEPTVEPRAVTPVFGWPVPVLGDVPNIPADMTALATGIEATVGSGHRFTVHSNTTQSVPVGTAMVLLAQGTATGPDASAWVGGKFVIPKAGLWQFAFTAWGLGGGTLFGRIDLGSRYVSAPMGASAYGGWCLTYLVRLNAGQQMQFEFFHSHTAAITVRSAVDTTYRGT